MNLTLHDIVSAHGDRVAEACSKAHQRLMDMDQGRIVPDEQVFLDSVIGDKLVDIPISVIDETVTVGDISSAVAERLAEIESDLMIIQDGRTFVDNDWVNETCWKIEQSQREEKDQLTVGAQPVALRTLALLQKEREAQDIADDIIEMKLQPRWAEALRMLQDEPRIAQDFIDTIVPSITQTELPDSSTFQHFTASEAVRGHPRNVTVDFAPGQIIVTLIIVLDWDDDASEAEVAHLDDHKLVIDQVFPETALAAAIGKPLETVFDHEYVRGLGLVIDSWHEAAGQTTINFVTTAATPLLLKDPPSNWWIG